MAKLLLDTGGSCVDTCARVWLVNFMSATRDSSAFIDYKYCSLTGSGHYSSSLSVCKIRLILSTRNKLYGKKNKANMIIYVHHNLSKKKNNHFPNLERKHMACLWLRGLKSLI